ncbi:Hypothetical predicted protein [Paramuricea clavata]|uniref:FP protein C-terminal domain-containing protein n=1 Tax=Paramuricea clavata TaxID=317549 RepID=A0A6S7H7S9_PARCT|nr:Hypothetical predicted protein [Paramuricea clavata]
MSLNYLTVEAFKGLWEKELLPSIKKEICSELAGIKRELEKLSSKCVEIEQSQNFLSDQYDSLLQTLQSTNVSIQNAEKDIKLLYEQTSSNKEFISIYDEQIDEIQQYLRRDCVEITGIPVTSVDDPKILAKELGDLMEVQVDERDISTAHRLPASKKVKDRIIVKFVNRDKRNQFYQRRSRLAGKSVKDLPHIANEIGSSRSNQTGKIYINESLTAYRKKLFGQINSFRKAQDYKFLWTMNGKILLRKNENSRVYGFTKESEFESFKSTLN